MLSLRVPATVKAPADVRRGARRRGGGGGRGSAEAGGHLVRIGDRRRACVKYITVTFTKTAGR